MALFAADAHLAGGGRPRVACANVCFACLYRVCAPRRRAGGVQGGAWGSSSPSPRGEGEDDGGKQVTTRFRAPPGPSTRLQTRPARGVPHAAAAPHAPPRDGRPLHGPVIRGVVGVAAAAEVVTNVSHPPSHLCPLPPPPSVGRPHPRRHRRRDGQVVRPPPHHRLHHRGDHTHRHRTHPPPPQAAPKHPTRPPPVAAAATTTTTTATAATRANRREHPPHHPCGDRRHCRRPRGRLVAQHPRGEAARPATHAHRAANDGRCSVAERQRQRRRRRNVRSVVVMVVVGGGGVVPPAAVAVAVAGW
ncbi:hypothetical protein I4F81_005886 [Pyropia yezoensis]|uniref:Uncharacterized protein n=1 Tax=Pyropia yezoensis TaxID=2788 RepID=A0ACC3C0M3_PYRYE|nr:hypothetical protein I4F81_005886 [Neopyropia yezoensis]